MTRAAAPLAPADFASPVPIPVPGDFRITADFVMQFDDLGATPFGPQ